MKSGCLLAKTQPYTQPVHTPCSYATVFPEEQRSLFYGSCKPLPKPGNMAVSLTSSKTS